MKQSKSVEKMLADKRIQVYVKSGVFEDLKELSERTGLSVSAISWMAFSAGYPQVRDGLLKLQPGKKPNASIPPQSKSR